MFEDENMDTFIEVEDKNGENNSAYLPFFYNELLKNHRIDKELYTKYDVKRGLRDSSGKGVLTGLTEISDVVGYKEEEGVRTPIDGQLYYQGYDVSRIIAGEGVKNLVSMKNEFF